VKAAERAHAELQFTKCCKTGSKGGVSQKLAEDQLKTD